MALVLFNVYDEAVGLQLELSGCNNRCVYCYSGRRSANKSTSLKSLENQINRTTKKDSLQNYYIKNRYPISVSNSSDLNACDNKDNYYQIVKFLKDLKFPIFYETKGCHVITRMRRQMR